MKKIQSLVITVSAILAIIFFGLKLINSNQKVFGAAPGGGMTIVASSTVKATVGSTSPVTLFSVNTGCTSRIITTYAAPIMITFATSTALSNTVKPTATFGHLQIASTTVAYDSGLYGCGVWQAYGFEANPAQASTTISLSEFAGFR